MWRGWRTFKELLVLADCDVGPWSNWTSCYLPPNVCGIGSMKRTRYGKAYPYDKDFRSTVVHYFWSNCLFSFLQRKVLRRRARWRRMRKDEAVGTCRDVTVHSGLQKPWWDDEGIIVGLKDSTFLFQLTARLGLGGRGVLVLPLAEEALKKGQGTWKISILLSNWFLLLVPSSEFCRAPLRRNAITLCVVWKKNSRLTTVRQSFGIWRCAYKQYWNVFLLADRK